MIKIRYSAPVAAALVLIALVSFQAWELRRALVERELDYSEGLLRNLAGRAQAALGRAFVAGDFEGVREVMSELYLYRRETEAFLIGPDGRIMASDHLGYEGAGLEALPVRVSPALLRKVSTGLEGEVVRTAGDHELLAYFPVSTAGRDAALYSRRAVLVVHLRVHRGMEEVNAILTSAIIRSFLVIALLVGLLWVGLSLGVTRRVRRLVDIMGAYLAGDLSIRSTERGGDEIGDIATSFNRLAATLQEKQGNLEASQAELTALAQTLEARVQDRTQALSLEVEERRRAEADLREREVELQTVLDLAPDGMVVIDGQGMIRKFNRAAEAIFGWTEAAVCGRSVRVLMAEPYRSARDGLLAGYQRLGEAGVIASEREITGADRQDNTFPIAFSVSQITLRGEPHYVGVIRDIRERKAAEAALTRTRETLLEAEKLAALGGLVAGVAHEINTPVGVSVTAVSHLMDEARALQGAFTSGAMKRSDLEHFIAVSVESGRIIESNLGRAAVLIRNFKEVAVDQTADDPRTIIVGDYVAQVLSSLHPMMKARPIRTRISVRPEDLAVRLRPGGVAQIITNLVTNSLRHGFGAEDAGEIAFETHAEGDDLLLVYSDNGRGMPADVVAKIFEPFFTTARGRGGSGLGMHIVYNLVTQTYGGEISCDSAPGRGARFSIRIPACVAGAAAQDEGASAT